MNKSQTNRQLGYPADARLLLINADDFGMCHAINVAIFRALTEGVVRSTTLMMPCPWALHAIHLLKEHPDLAFGVHLAVICDTVDYKFGPLTPKEKVPSLLDETGYFYSFERMAEFLAQAQLAELETEFRAQIEAVLAAQLKPTHLDWHCLRFGSRTEIFDLMIGLAKEYGLALRVVGQQSIEQVQRQHLPTNDYDFLDSFRLDLVDKSGQYGQLLRELPAGLSEWAVHPGLGNAELQVIQPSGWQVRQTDFDFLVSQEAQNIVKEQGIILVDYRQLQAVWRSA
ncbi:MAG: polysaccharide deacetylase family protein [Chloroflexi bacterium]|nr:polysaccharide deacetylase family protein [Chloroflexota bacterium]